MSHPPQPQGQDHPPKRQLLTLRNASGEELVLEDAAAEASPASTVIATDSNGNSLTLLEEYALRKRRTHPAEVVLSFLCAAASLAFAALIYIKTY